MKYESTKRAMKVNHEEVSALILWAQERYYLLRNDNGGHPWMPRFQNGKPISTEELVSRYNSRTMKPEEKIKP
jgi:hypothetical protein